MPTARASSPGRVAAPTASPAPRVKRIASTLISTLAGAAVLGGVAYGAYELHRFETRPLTLDGIELPDGECEPFVRGLAVAWEETAVTLDAGSHVERATRRELGGRVDPDRVIDEVRAARGGAPIWTRVWAMITGRETALRFTREVRMDDVRAFASAMPARVDTPAVSARRDGTGGHSGVALNVNGATAEIADALAHDRLLVQLPVSVLEPFLRSRRSPVFTRFDRLVAEYETRYAIAGEQAGRAHNIELAARQLDNRTIAAGGELSFNEAVGERSHLRGFVSAVELTGEGRRTEGIGGGICQVAATLHAAAFFGAFEIVEHHPHTRYSRYIENGLDAAVSWPHRDLRIRNPHPFPVRVRATAYRGTMRVALLGEEAAPRVEWSTRVLTRVERSTQRAASEPTALEGTEEEVLDDGVDGAVIERSRTIHWEDGAVSEVRHLRYPVVHRLVRRAAAAPPELEDEP